MSISYISCLVLFAEKESMSVLPVRKDSLPISSWWSTVEFTQKIILTNAPLVKSLTGRPACWTIMWYEFTPLIHHEYFRCTNAMQFMQLQKTVHVPDSDKPAKPKLEFYCGMCRKVLRSKRSYLAHTKSHHVTPKKCSYCCETFSRQSVLVRHIRISHDPQYESSESKVLLLLLCHLKMLRK